jgi:tetratricopeptide (TPR) repeat protein
VDFFVKNILFVLIFSIMALSPRISVGQQPQLLQAEPSEVAMQALGLAKHYYSKGQFEKAADLFMEAYQLDARVEFMFNAARAYQRAIKLKRAKALFNRCLKTSNAPAVVIEKAKIYLQEIENMEKALHQAKHDGEKEASDAYITTKTKVVARNKIKKEPKQEWKGSFGSTTLGLGGVAATVGAYLLLNAYELSGASDSAADSGEIDYGEYDRQKTKAEKLNVIGWGAVGLGAVTAGFGIWCLATQPDKVIIAPMPNGVSVAVRF